MAGASNLFYRLLQFKVPAPAACWHFLSNYYYFIHLFVYSGHHLSLEQKHMFPFPLDVSVSGTMGWWSGSTLEAQLLSWTSSHQDHHHCLLLLLNVDPLHGILFSPMLLVVIECKDCVITLHYISIPGMTLIHSKCWPSPAHLFNCASPQA